MECASGKGEDADALAGRFDVSNDIMSFSGTFSFSVEAYGDEGYSSAVESETVELHTLSIPSNNSGDRLRLCVKGGSAIGPVLEAQYLPTLTAEGDSYTCLDEQGEKRTLVALTSTPASDYKTMAALLADACWPSTGSGYASKLSEDTWISSVWDSDLCTDGDLHDWSQAIVKGSFGKSGAVVMKCGKCGRTEYVSPIVALTEVKLSKTSYTYDGKAKKPTVTVCSYDGPLSTTEYKVSYTNNVNVGTAKATVTMKSKYYEGTKTLTFKIAQAANSVTAKTSVSKTFKLADAKKKQQTVTLPTATAKFGKATWKVATADSKKVLSLKSGKVVVKKGAKKGTYTIKLKASVPATSNYQGATTKAVTVRVTVK
jgi:hypothetical protein